MDTSQLYLLIHYHKNRLPIHSFSFSSSYLNNPWKLQCQRSVIIKVLDPPISNENRAHWGMNPSKWSINYETFPSHKGRKLQYVRSKKLSRFSGFPKQLWWWKLYSFTVDSCNSQSCWSSKKCPQLWILLIQDIEKFLYYKIHHCKRGLYLICNQIKY